MANDTRPFQGKNVGNPKSDIKEFTVSKPKSMGSKSFTIPKNVGAANRSNRK